MDVFVVLWPTDRPACHVRQATHSRERGLAKAGFDRVVMLNRPWCIYSMRYCGYIGPYYMAVFVELLSEGIKALRTDCIHRIGKVPNRYSLRCLCNVFYTLFSQHRTPCVSAVSARSDVPVRLMTPTSYRKKYVHIERKDLAVAQYPGKVESSLSRRRLRLRIWCFGLRLFPLRLDRRLDSGFHTQSKSVQGALRSSQLAASTSLYWAEAKSVRWELSY